MYRDNGCHNTVSIVTTVSGYHLCRDNGCHDNLYRDNDFHDTISIMANFVMRLIGNNICLHPSFQNNACYVKNLCGMRQLFLS